MAKAKGNNKISLNAETLCEIVSDWLNSGGPFAKSPITVTGVKGTYDDTFDFTFEQGKPALTEKPERAE
jgi:hypothetical protein